MEKTIFIVITVISGLAMLLYYLKSNRPTKSAVKGMLSGGIALVLVSIFGTAYGVSLSLSLFNTATALILGVPGVLLLVVGKFVL